MAVYVYIFNLIINKKAIAEKYIGGIEKFRKDYNIPSSEFNQEDGRLFSLTQMNADEFDIDKLVMNGLSFDEDLRYSSDFTIVYRYGDGFWEVDWLKHNKVFAWHIDASSVELNKVDEISNMTMDRITELIENGNGPLKTIWVENQ